MENKNNIYKILLLFFTIFIILSSAFILYRYDKIKIEKNSKAKNVEKMQLELAELEQKLLKKEFTRLISGVLVIKGIIEEDINDEDGISNLSFSERMITRIVKNKRIYDQIRYIDEKGNEIIRIDLEDDEPVVYKGDHLQNKADRYYFVDTMNTSEGEIYASKLDLNVENGKIEEPIKPVARVATKIYDKNKNEKGIVILNYFAHIMIEDFVDVSKSRVGSSYLLNQDAYFISNTEEPSTEFAFMYDDKQELNFKNMYPLAYDEIFNKHQEFFETEDDIFFAKKVVVFNEADGKGIKIPVDKIVLGDGDLVVVSHINKSEHKDLYMGSVFDNLYEIINKDIASLVIIFVLSILFSFIIRSRIEQRNEEKYLSEFDEATGVLNRRAGLEKLDKLIDKTRTMEIDMGIVFVDVNGLKSVNDILGHNYGDELIRTSAQIMKNTIRQNDVLFRYGGDEFVMCLSKVGYEGAVSFWVRILEQIDEVNKNAGLKYNISLSHGFSLIPKEEKNVDINKHINEADENMYKEKLEIKKTAVIIKK